MKYRNILDQAHFNKWPGTFISGTKITPEQALEVIRRTDTFFISGYGGYDREYEEKALEILDHPYKNGGAYPRDMKMDDWAARWKAKEQWDADWGIVQTEYIDNSWISCSYIGGPHGWCHPDGTIAMAMNVGKWPNSDEIYADLKTLATAFPFLDMQVLMIRDEITSGDIFPTIGFLVKNGRVRPVLSTHPKVRHLIPGAGDHTFNMDDLYRCFTMSVQDREHAISLDQLKKWRDQVDAKRN